MKTYIDINSWKRKEHFALFMQFEDPFFGITTNLDCTNTHEEAKRKQLSFFLLYMYKSLKAVNAIEELRCRIEDGKPVCYNVIHAATTVQNKNELYSYAFLPYCDNFEEFYGQAKESVDKASRLEGLGADENSARPDVIHYSTIPWISFTAVNHARCFARKDSIPKISFGKYFEQNGRLLLPVDLHAHHGLADGLHASRYFELFQNLLDAEVS